MKTKIMTKMFSIIALVVICLCTLIGCTPNLEVPGSTDAVTGNGGLAVQKGQYLYFVNGYIATSNMSDGDNLGGANYSAIYRTKLDNNNLVYNEDGELQDCERVIDKVCGFNKTKLFIFDNHIYYATPNTEKVIKDDVLQNDFDLTDFYRANLDGSNVKHLYKTDVASDSTQFNFYKTKDSDTVNLVVFDGSKLVVVNCSTQSATTVAEDVSTVAMSNVENYNPQNNTISAQEATVFYTRSGTEEEDLDTGNVLAYTVVGENTEHKLASDRNTYNVKSVNKDALVLTINGKDTLNLEANYFATFNDEGKIVFDLNIVLNNQLDYTAHSEVLLCNFEDNNAVGFVSVNANKKVVIYDYTNNNKTTLIDTDKELTLLSLNGNYVYAYDTENSLYRINYKQAMVEADPLTCVEKIYDSTKLTEDEEDDEQETVADIYFEAKTNFDVDGNFAYFYVNYKGETETGYYLNRIDLTDSQLTSNLVGSLQASHKVEKNTEN